MSFIGKTIKFDWLADGVLANTQSATVGAGVEFTIVPVSSDLTFDISDDEITQSYSGFGLFSNTDIEYAFTDINGTLPQIVNAGVTIFGSGTSPTVSFTADVVKLTFLGASNAGAGLNYVVDVDFAGATVTAGDDAVTALEDVTFSGNVLDNDAHSEADTLFVSAVSGGTVGAASTGTNGGTFVINADGTFTFDAGSSFDSLRAGQTATTSITYTARDSNFVGGPSDTATITVTVNGQDYAPSGTDTTVTTLENVNYVYTLADFGFSDLDGDAFTEVLLTNQQSPHYGPGFGLRLNGAFLSDGATASAAQIAAGLLQYSAQGNYNGPNSFSFDFQVRDSSGALDASPNLMTLDITPVNNAPSGANKTLTTNEDTSITLSFADFGFSDSNEGNSLLAVKITTLPTAGTLSNNGVAVLAGQFVSVADITAGLLNFTPALNASGAGYATFTFQVQDNGGTLNGGRDLDLTPNTITIDVNAVNDAPTALVASGLITSIAENSSTAARVKIADLSITDVDGGANALTVSGADAARFEIVGNAVYLKAGTDLDFETKNAYSFTVDVNDPSINGNAVEVSRNFVLAVTDVNEAPTVALTGATTSLAENASTTAARTVATIVVTDDDLGSEIFTLSGADASLFQISGNKLQIKAGAVLDFETNPNLNVTVNVNDPAINGNAIESSASLSIGITDVMETLNGTSGANTLNGTGASERINGLAGNDTLRGNGGDDILIGGAGIDILSGGAGRDTFVFTSVSDSGAGYSGYINNSGSLHEHSGSGKRDVITDFTHGMDKIDLSAIDANTMVSGNQAFKFSTGAAFTAAAGQLIAVQFNALGTANDKTIVYGDVNGDRIADFQIELTGLKALTASDFFL